MNPVDTLLSLSIPALIVVHLLVAPYTKIEESFNIEATHDILRYGLPTHNITSTLAASYDHVSYPGPVPRSFMGPLLLACLSQPFTSLFGFHHGQFIVRAALGLLNAFALLRFKSSLAKAFGRDVGRWYILLQASQFHVIFYASRTLPNMFAFGLTTLALAEFVPSHTPLGLSKKQQRGIFFFVLSGVLYRSEVAAYLFAQLAYLFAHAQISLNNIISAGLISAFIALSISIPIDSYFYQRLLWPELAGFYFNVIQGNASGWGTSPWHTYFTHSLPRLLLSPLTYFVLMPVSAFLPATKASSRGFIIPAFLFIAFYSLIPHKEPRFIIYTVPALTASASLCAAYVWTRRWKSLFYKVASLVLAVSILMSLLISVASLLISSLNYPGGEASYTLHQHIHQDLLSAASSVSSLNPRPTNITVNVHTDVLSLMTGATLFLQSSLNTTLTIPSYKFQDSEIIPVVLQYDKTEREDYIDMPDFWHQFDYVLTEHPEFAVGEWDAIDTAWAYKGLTILKPGEKSIQGDIDLLTKVYHGNQAVDEEHGLGRDAVQHAVQDLEEKAQRDHASLTWEEIKKRWRVGPHNRFEIWRGLRDAIRLVSGGWYVGPDMRPEIWILRRAGNKIWEGKKTPLRSGGRGLPWKQRGGRRMKGGHGP